ncbi:hypothetical protein KAR91_79760 [Candidatus Pacearchaeota archaeon]|nr:hypothetical protein [Candidatus Pacearchaeota archaeon]
MNEGIAKVNTQASDPDVVQEVYEIEKHLHSAGNWFEKAAVPSGSHKADRIGVGTPFEIDAGNNDFGTWVEIIGSDDTPARSGNLYFDPHQMLVEDTETASLYFIQMTRGDDPAVAWAAGVGTEFPYQATVQKETGIIEVQTGRAPAGSRVWARCKAIGQNTSKFYFFIGIHEYTK